MGTGWIVERFVGAASRNTQQRFVAIASRDAARAGSAAQRLGIPRAYARYEELAADPDVDVVYVATGHAQHVGCALTALEHGKHTLVEKPLALNAEQARRVAEVAERQGVFCAEALWSFFLPRYDVVRQLLADGALGDVHTVLADYGESFPPNHRILRADQCGGPLLDLGTYPISFATWVLGGGTGVLATSLPHPAGVHGQVAAVLSSAQGAQGVVHTSLFGDTATTACVSGSAATLLLPGPFYQPGDVLLTPAGGGTPLSLTAPPIAHEGLFYEAAETARCVVAGRRQTALRTLSDSIATLETMDAIRQACGIAYPGEHDRQ
jgi:predicted dehydrogenase